MVVIFGVASEGRGYGGDDLGRFAQGDQGFTLAVGSVEVVGVVLPP